MKKLLFWGVFILLPMLASAQKVEINGIYYILSSDGTATVARNPNNYSGNVVIPKQVSYQGKQYTVTKIKEETKELASDPYTAAFTFCKDLISVTIPSSVTYIGDGAFSGCTGLTSVHISDLKAWCGIYFGHYSSNPLYYAHHLYLNGEEIKDLIIPNSVTSIRNNAFSGCSELTSVTIPNSVTSIGEYAFAFCTGLTSINIPSGVTSISKYSFYGSGLTSIIIPSGVTSISDYAFSGCKSLSSVTIGNNVTSIGYNSFSDCIRLRSITIPNSVTNLSGFSGCYNLTSIIIPESVKFINSSAFEGCDGLTSVTIPNGITAIGRKAFSGCSGLTSVTIPNSVTSIGENAFSGCSGLTSVTIPNSVTSIGICAFGGCRGLTSVTIPNSVTSIGSSAFSACYGLTSVTIPSRITSIESHTFSGCSGLTSVTIPSSVTSIGMDAFYECKSLQSLVIGENVSYIRSSAFYGCAQLKEVYCYAKKVPDVESNPFSSLENIVLHVPAETIEDYRITKPWMNFNSIVVLTDDGSPVVPKCATPEIFYDKGEITFNCATEGAEFISLVTVGDAKKYYDSKINLSHTYVISVYATKDGYQPSDVATKEITISDGGSGQESSVKGDVNGDGEVNVADHVALSDIIMTAADTNIETNKITASFTGGAYIKIDGRIQADSKLNVMFSNKSNKNVTLTKMQLNDAATGIESDNLLDEEVVVAAGQDVSYTITVGPLGISKPVISFTYKYNNTTYQAIGEW